MNELLQFIACKASDMDGALLAESYAEKVLHLLADCVVAETSVPNAPNKASNESDDKNSSSANTTMLGNSTPTVRKLEDLSVEEVGSLLDSVNLGALKEPLKARNVSGAMLSFCEEADELQADDFGVTNKTLARGLMRKITEWKGKGVSNV